jgi:hypothetical protein
MYFIFIFIFYVLSFIFFALSLTPFVLVSAIRSHMVSSDSLYLTDEHIRKAKAEMTRDPRLSVLEGMINN